MEGIEYRFLAVTSAVFSAILLFIFGQPGNMILSALPGFSGGIMPGISAFELMPEGAGRDGLRKIYKG